MTPFEQQLTIAVATLDEGEVVSYGDIAAAAGRPRAHRAAGRFLANSGLSIPWWRVVYSDGRLAECNIPRQKELLEQEGVEFTGTRVVRAPKGRFSAK